MSATSAPFGMRPVYHPTGLDRAFVLANGITSGYAYDLLKGQAVKLSGGVIIRSDGGTVLHNGTHKEERFGLNVWANTFEEASQLANVLEAILKTLSTDTIKKVEISLSPTRVDYEGKEEQRYITCSALIASDNFTL